MKESKQKWSRCECQWKYILSKYFKKFWIIFVKMNTLSKVILETVHKEMRKCSTISQNFIHQHSSCLLHVAKDIRQPLSFHWVHPHAMVSKRKQRFHPQKNKMKEKLPTKRNWEVFKKDILLFNSLIGLKIPPVDMSLNSKLSKGNT